MDPLHQPVAIRGLEVLVPKEKRTGFFVPEGDILDAIVQTPEMAGVVTINRPELVPELLATSYVHAPSATNIIRAAAWEEFMRTDGMGETAKTMLRAALRVEGPSAEIVRKEFSNFVAHRDNHSGGFDNFLANDQAKTFAAADNDPAYGHFYGAFFVEPAAAAQQLMVEADTDRVAFDVHTARLHQLFNEDRSASKSFLWAVSRLQGRSATSVKLRVIDHLHVLLAPEIAGLNALAVAGVRSDSSATKKVETLIPGLAELVSDPEVSRVLVRRSHIPGDVHDDRVPPLQVLMEELMSSKFGDPTRRDVRERVAGGAANLLDQAAESTDTNERSALESTAGGFLGAAANADRKVGSEAGILEGTGWILEKTADFMPGGSRRKDGKDGSSSGLPFNRGAKFVGKFLSAIAPRRPETEWTRTKLDEMLRATYEKHHPVPSGEYEDAAVKAYENEYLVWSREAAQAFLNEFNGAPQ